MCNRACVGSLCPSILRARTFQQLQILLQGDFLRVGLPQRRAKSRKGFRRSPNQCGVLRGQMAKVDLQRVALTLTRAGRHAYASA